MTDTDLARRLEKLKRDNRRLKRLALLPLVLIVALGAIYATRPVPDVIKAHEFDVVDNQGRVRAVIDVDWRGGPGLYLRGADGKLRAELSSPGHKTGLYLYNAQAK